MGLHLSVTKSNFGEQSLLLALVLVKQLLVSGLRIYYMHVTMSVPE